MVEEKISKSQSQRKRRHERDTCINNLKLNLNLSSTKADYIRSVKTNRDQVPWRTNKSNSQERIQNSLKDKYARGSLDNVSGIPWEGSKLDGLSTLRRTRSFAISRENLFYSLDFIETTENYKRRPQLIPRAKLVEKSFIKDSRYESFQVENTQAASKKSPNKPQEIPPDYSPLPRSNSHNNFSLEGNIYDIPPGYPSRNNSPFPGNKEGLSADRDTKISDNSRYRKSLEDLAGLSLPNYYPDSEFTDNISVTDNQSTFSQDKSRYISLDNVPWSISEQPESISYDENIVLAKKTEGFYARPKTIRGPTPYRNFDYEKLPQFNPDNFDQINETEKVSETTTEQHSSLEFETNTNCDEIKLNNENIRKYGNDNESLKCEKQESHYSVNEIIDKLKTKVDVSLACIEKPAKAKIEAIRKPDIETENTSDVNPLPRHSDNQIKTLIEVCSVATAQGFEKSEDFKSIVTVDTDKSDILTCNEEEAKNHSHNYLKEFLETQKGSKKPLQSFIAKKFSNLTRRRSKSNLTSNQFYSLPDITASKNLHKCEKIDRKLRKCEKLNKAPERIPENRFIVNIGKHFDITAKSTIPVDFQVKIAKVPKKNKKHTKNKDSEQEFREAVKNINTTLQNNGFCTDLNNNNKNAEVKATNNKTDEMDPEIQEKVDNMRNYWTKIAGNNNSDEKCDKEKEPESPTCQITEIHTKVNSVKKKFEPAVEVIEDKNKSPTKVQLAKQLFEPKIVPEKAGKISPTIKQTCNYFERHSFSRNSNCYESLCPSSVELITQSEETNEQNRHSANENNKPRKSLAKSNSISVPEFDHVRYKVIKPELFNKKILANCETEAQFDGLMQYLQDYSFQELLIDNNIVIIEPIRSKVPYHKSKSPLKSTKINNGINEVPKLNEDGEFDDVKQGIRKHFFYHPIRVNKEVNDDELPNPEVVRQARQFFEKGVIKSQSSEEIGLAKERYREGSVDPDKDKCSTSDSHSTLDSTLSEAGEEPDNMYDSLDNNECCTTEYVSEDILEKIREYGTTVTYYGGRVFNQNSGQPILTKVIMEEIKDNEKRCMECSSCRRRSIDKTLNEVNNEYQGIKFKLVKSNSCSSRLELVGAANKKDNKKKLANRKNNNKINTEKNNNSIKDVNDEEVIDKSAVIKGTPEFPDKNAINENIKLNNKIVDQPRIIGEERKIIENNKYIQWSEVKKEQTHANIQFNEKSNVKIKNYDYQEKMAPARRPCDMEFEPYEVA